MFFPYSCHLNSSPKKSLFIYLIKNKLTYIEHYSVKSYCFLSSISSFLYACDLQKMEFNPTTYLTRLG